jgi:ammonia channel protein AmtB
MGLWASRNKEVTGLDIGEHQETGYSLEKFKEVLL